MSWTVVHPIDEESPLYGLTQETLLETETEIVILLKAFDETFSQTVASRASYIDESILFNSRFKPMFFPDEVGITTFDLSKISEIELAG